VAGADAFEARVALGGAVAIGGAVALFFAATGRPGLAVLGLPIAAGLGWAFGRRSRRRRAIAKEPFPIDWREILDARVPFYRALGDAEKRRFELEVRFFLDEQTISGARGTPVRDETRLLVAASAVLLVFGRPGYRWSRVRDVVVYPDDFDEEYRVASGAGLLGIVHGQGPILLSERALRHGFENPHDGENVGLHELAHVLDLEAGGARGVPSLMPWKSVRPWTALVHAEMARVRQHRSLLRGYAAKNEAEFFAVATEVFFERPHALRERHPELYAMLCEAYGQDPASSSAAD